MQYIFSVLFFVFLVALGYQAYTQPERHCDQMTSGTINGEPVQLCTEKGN
jgi:hypothetical protein